MWRSKGLARVRYRLGQVYQQLGMVAPLSAAEFAEVARLLPEPALALFASMSDADRRHAMRVYRGLQARGCEDEELLMAALLHDVGKARGHIPFWTRPVIVLGRTFAPRLLARVPYPDDGARGRTGAAFIFPRKRLPCPYHDTDGTSLRSSREGGLSIWRLWWAKWLRSLGYAWYHADVGADLAAAAGLSDRCALYIRTHHQSAGPAALLHEVDEVS